MRAVEISLGIPVPGITLPESSSVSSASNATGALSGAATSIFNAEVRQVLLDAIPILAQVVEQLSINTVFGQNGLRSLLKERQPLVTTFMDVNWQFNDPANPAAAAIGPQGYDNHLYYSSVVAAFFFNIGS